MLVLSIFSILILFSELTTTNANNAQEAPLKFIWQVATQGKCQKKGVHINVTQYGILENSNPGSDGFEGNVITELYYTVGKWPFIERDDRPGKTPREWINGGLPQLGDLEGHLAEVERYIKASHKIPKDFSGIGVLDFEEWFAIFDLNFKNSRSQMYRDETYKLADSKDVAIKEYNQAARKYFEETMRLVQNMFPESKWCYYIYPKCNYKPDTKRCAPHMYEFIKELDWLVKLSDILCPSVYFYVNVTAVEKRPGMIVGNVDITRDHLDYVEQPHKPIYLYIKTSEGKVRPFFGDADLIYSLGTAVDMGVDAIVLWGSTQRTNTKELCIGEKEHVAYIGPYIQRLINFAGNCSRDLCNSQGRCAKNYVEVDVEKISTDLDADHVYIREDVAQQYHCRCYEGWTGTDCAQSA